MNNNTIDYLIDYFKFNTSKKKPITNERIDQLLQSNLGIKPIGDGGIRALIHEIRKNYPIVHDDTKERGWVCGGNDGYYITYNAHDILDHMNQFEGKIRKMMVIHRKGMEILMDKIYYKQSTLKFEES
jgi:hypothetical protein